MRKLCLYIACSLDGYIAQQNEDLSFLKLVEKEGEYYGYAAFTSQVDTIILGRKTYDWVMRNVGSTQYDNGDRHVYVITRTARPIHGRTIFYSEDLVELVNRLKSQQGKNIYCDGGAEIIKALLEADLIDEMTISIVPILLGNGIPLFQDNRPEQLLELIESKSFSIGLVQLHYSRKR